MTFPRRTGVLLGRWVALAAILALTLTDAVAQSPRWRSDALFEPWKTTHSRTEWGRRAPSASGAGAATGPAEDDREDRHGALSPSSLLSARGSCLIIARSVSWTKACAWIAGCRAPGLAERTAQVLSNAHAEVDLERHHLVRVEPHFSAPDAIASGGRRTTESRRGGLRAS